MKKHLHAEYPFLTILLLLLMQQSAFSQGANRVDIGKSFANMSKLQTGGTFNPGDTIEIRVTIAVIRQGSYTALDSVQVFDQVPAKTTYIPGSMRIATNEGITFKGPFTEAVDTDPGRNVAGNITINLGNKANGVNGGRIRSDTSRPSFYGSHCIMMACYKVRINPTAVYGDTLRITGRVRYKMVTPANGFTDVFFPQYRILLFPNSGYCPNGSDISAASDFGGTFGSGTVPNRAAPLGFATTYIKQNISTGQPQDYNYAIIKNSSADSWTNPAAPMPEASALHRVFGFWDIAGDHTNASNTAFGNAPPAAAQNSGYFVLINASYNTNVAYQETLTNLCPNTYYEFSAWFRNVCPRCSCDSTGRGSGAAGFIRGPGNDSSGVKPNLNFEIDGQAYYTTGDIKYDRGVPWKKFGFTFLTKSNQTTANFAIRNNSPGGGGNDWAIDDIKVSHCGPTLTMNYNPEVIGCKEGAFVVDLKDTIRFIYNSYVHFKWQRSNVGGTIWTNMTGPGTSGIGTPVLVNGLYQYVTALPPFLATGADSGTYYRVVVATTAANLNNNCSYRDQNTTMVRAITCGTILNGNFLQFRGSLAGGKSQLSWATSNEKNLSYYEIEKSADGSQFKPIGRIDARNLSEAFYNYTDPEEINGRKYYRLKMTQADGMYKYSNIIELNSNLSFRVNNIQNPFDDKINADITVPEAGLVHFNLYNGKGQKVKVFSQAVNKGFSKIPVTNLGNISAGIYYITVEFKNQIQNRKLVKQ
ncbi:MAG: T9SS type A sorting domain-containing protein [Gloeobacteraceae cyanobacterium ES-bin-316]|nr:T9SS type A sorting domain-containing protein [Ferruginibacter sp.]